MSPVRGRDTKPEVLVRSIVHRLGYRFRVHRRDLPGKPDIVLTRHGKVVFVHGCFWHSHEGCPIEKAGYKRKILERKTQSEHQERHTISQGTAVQGVEGTRYMAM